MKKHIIYILTTAIVIFTAACNNDKEPITPTLAIGDFHQGGVIFYLDNTGEHGLVSSVSDQSFNADWGCPPLIIDGADGLTIGTGSQNTIDILNRCSNSGIAADICDKLELNGFSDWYLPSKDELDSLYQNRDEVNVTAIANGGTQFEGAEYWSSSHQNSNTVFVQHFTAGNQFGVSEDKLYNVRAIRTF